ncbi:MAG: superoxide dismutase [Bacteroidetes bacterium RIFOXYA12_FULL_35_11]|nr:MAG: superoxide dismutase [Bacteroidetes bacterium GWF2_35_48]OFY81951.1 MAG: superoxide dismutase [Bacteroidetes bacterium RIFOXYA12_FULL_35_11]HBX52201.1 superoxide dismutase [Bacteroidales bacterium]
MLFELPKLPYAINALEPHISQKTLEFHYGKHHLAYVTNLNGLVPGTKFENASLEQIIREADGGIFNNGAQVWNHTFYWEGFTPVGGGEPGGKLQEAILKNFGSLAEFKEKFTKASATLFGAGWSWLVAKQDGTLDIVQESNAGNPLRANLKPLLTCDVWEHAYYLDFQNRRPDYVNTFWNLIDWKKIEERFSK